MKKFYTTLAAALLAVSFSGLAHANSISNEFSAGPLFGTTGVGVQVAAKIIPGYLNLNTGFSGLSINHDLNAGGIHYDGKLRLGGVPVYLSVFPFHNNFHLDGGMFVNNTRLTATAQSGPGNTYDINSHSYNAAELGTLSGRTHFNAVSPYLGIGYGDPFLGGRLTFTANAGVIFSGTPDITLNAPGANSIPGATADIAVEQNELNHDVRFLTVFPVVNVGLVYRF